MEKNDTVIHNGGYMRYLTLMLLLAGCTSGGAVPCSRFGCPDTPIGNYNEWSKPGTAPLPEGVSYSCRMGGTEIIVRGAKNPDPQTCKPVERI
jgi:hypothetical protein